MDNIFIERLRRALGYEAVYPHELSDGFKVERVRVIHESTGLMESGSGLVRFQWTVQKDPPHRSSKSAGLMLPS